MRANDVVLVDTSSPLHPARSEPRAFPQAVRDASIVAADVSPDGKLLALATEEGNQVVMLDLGPAGHTPVAGMLAVAPEMRESVLADVGVRARGRHALGRAGDTPRSAAVGPEPTELRAVRLRSDAQSMANLTAARVVEVADAAAPVRLGVGRALPLASGAAIRLPPERNTVFFAATAHPGSSNGIFRVGAEDAATVAMLAARPGSDARTSRPRAAGCWRPRRRRTARSTFWRRRSTAVRPPGCRAPRGPAGPRGGRDAARRTPRARAQDPALKRVRAIVRGRVQGVGYRASAAHEARRLGLAGWVRNLPDGTVEVEARGAAAAVDALVGWLAQGPRGARVRGVDVQDSSDDLSSDLSSVARGERADEFAIR